MRKSAQHAEEVGYRCRGGAELARVEAYGKWAHAYSALV